MKKKSLVAAAVLIAAGIALFVCALIAAGGDFTKLTAARYETNTYAVEEEFGRIRIHSEEADVVFEPSADGKCSVVCLAREKAEHAVFVENGTLTVRAGDTRAWYEHLLLFAKTPKITVYLPAEEYESLVIGGGTGDISLPDAFSFGSIYVEISTGDILCLASADGELALKTSTGNIRLEGAAAKNIQLSVSTGSVVAESVTCKETISIQVSTGDSRLTDVRCGGLDSRGSTGDISLKNVVASESFHIERSTGDVSFENCDAMQITVQTTTGDVTGTLQTEKIFLADSSTGKIQIPVTAVAGGLCQITTSTGDIVLAIAGE